MKGVRLRRKSEPALRHSHLELTFPHLSAFQVGKLGPPGEGGWREEGGGEACKAHISSCQLSSLLPPPLLLNVFWIFLKYQWRGLVITDTADVEVRFANLGGAQGLKRLLLATEKGGKGLPLPHGSQDLAHMRDSSPRSAFTSFLPWLLPAFL